MKRIVGIFAHPDDESFTCGGTFAKYAKSGATIDLICASRGEAGDAGPYEHAKGEKLGVIRQRELEVAATVLGCTSLTFLDYKDGVLATRTPGDIEDVLFRKMVELTPNIVITFEPGGISNHPDHVKISLAATYAFQKYAASIKEVTKRGISPLNPPRHARDVWQISFAQTIANEDDPKLYYACMPQSAAEYLKKQKIIPAESFEKPWTGTSDKMITTVIDITKFQSAKIKALASHSTQREDVEKFLSLPSNPLLRQEFFYLRLQGDQEVFMGKNDRVANRL